VAVVQRVGLDGVYVRREDGARHFHELDTPSREDVEDIARRTAKRLHRAFRNKGRVSPWDEPELSDRETEPG
jgi:hypothetical protein